MASNYPSALDTFNTSRLTGDTIHAQTDNDQADAINKIERAIGAGVTNGRLKVVQEAPLNARWPEYAALGSNAIQAAVDVAETADKGAVYVPSGLYTPGALTHPSDTPVHIFGDGRGATVLSWPTDLGAGEHALASSTPMDGSGNVVIEGMTLRGGGTYTPGSPTPPCAMDGIRMASHATYRDIRVEKFNTAMVVDSDHTRTEGLQVADSKYAIYFPDDSSTADNNVWVDTLVDVGWAGIACGGDATISSNQFFGLNMVGLAIQWYREAYVAGHWMLNCLVSGWTCESIGNALFYDESFVASAAATDSIHGVTFDGCAMVGNSFGTTYRDAGKQRTANYNLYSMDQVRFVGPVPATSIATESIFKLGGPFARVTFDDLREVIEEANTAAIVPFKSTQAPLGVNGRMLNPTSGENDPVRVVALGGTVAKWDLVKSTGGQRRVAQWTSGSIPDGVAAHAHTGGGTLVVLEPGAETPIKSGANTIAQGDWIKGDTTAGQVVKTSANPPAAADHPVVGFAVSGSSGGFTTCRLRISD